MKKIILFILLLIIPFKTFALTQNDKYFNLEFPSTFNTDLTSVIFGGNTDMYDVIDSLKSLNNNYRNISIILFYNASGFNRLNIVIHPKDSVNSVLIYGYPNNSNLNIYNVLSFSKSSQRIQLQSDNGSTSFLDSAMYTQIKTCVEQGNCPTSKPTETSYTGSITYNSSTSSISNNYYTISNFDNTLDYDVKNQNLLYFSNTKYVVTTSVSDSYIYRNLKYNGLDIEVGDYYPSYIDYINIPDNPDEPDNPDNPIDTNVGVWKNMVFWFVDNNSEYGVLVNIYILLLLFIVGTSFIVFVKMIRKNRW